MFLLVGPPGSGKTLQVLQQLRASLQSGREGSLLLVPTSTMAEHLRNQLAREGFVYRPDTILTFSKFVEKWVEDLTAVSTAALEILVERALDRVQLARFSSVRDFPGFRRTVVGAIEEISAAGGDSNCLDGLVQRSLFAAELRLVYEDVEKEVERRGWLFRSALLRTASQRILDMGLGQTTTVFASGFYSFTPGELAVIDALRQRSSLTVTLPEWPGAEAALEAFRNMGAEEVELGSSESANVQRVLAPAPTIDLEATEIARRIHKEREQGRAFREIGIIIRSEQPYAGALHSALERFRIPARFYFGSPLVEHPAVRYLTALVDAMLTGWDHQATLAALRMSGSPLELSGAGDLFEYAVLEQLPGVGLDSLKGFDADGHAEFWHKLKRLDSWRSSSAIPRVWAERFRSLRSLSTPPLIADRQVHERALLWKSQAAALDSFEQAVNETGQVLDADVPAGCGEFWRNLKMVIQASTLRVPDHRRDVVHVIDAFEARQWKLPVVFVCGLLEKQFPKYHTENPILPDEARLRLRSRGVQLRTSAERQGDERFLFDLACSRASSLLVLSYPQMNAKGDATLPSFFLEQARQQYAFEEQCAMPVRPLPRLHKAPERAVSIYEEDLRLFLQTRHAVVSPSGIETFLQCPYQFFAQNTLKLNGPPKKPWDRLNIMTQGSIVHDCLEQVYRNSEPLVSAFDRVFRQKCAEERIPQGYRTEAIRLELLHNLGLFLAQDKLTRGVESYFEQKFKLRLDEETSIEGRIDRIEVDSEGRATVIDYKYRSANGIRNTVKAHEEQKLVQGGLYLLALESLGDFEPAGMLYCGMKREVTWGGWVLAPFYSEFGQGSSPEGLRDLTRKAKELAHQAIVQIRDGRIEPKPADETKCEYCAFVNACRFEVTATRTASRGAAG